MKTLDTNAMLNRAAAILKRRTPRLDAAQLTPFIQEFLDRRDTFLALAETNGSPLYVLEPEVLRERAAQLIEAFTAELPRLRVYYALKSNSHPTVARTLVDACLGLDVSSGLELELAVNCGATDIVFSGPGKTDDELRLAVRRAERTTVLIDSFAELHRLERVASDASTAVRAGVRLTVDERGLWRKFGVTSGELRRFLNEASSCSHVRVGGLQFHSSWNLDAAQQVNFITRLGRTVRGLSAEQRAGIEFIDIGGGFWPAQGEWLQHAATPEGRLQRAIDPDAALSSGSFCLRAAPIEDFAQRIGEAVGAHLLPHVDCAICVEPGRWLCNDAMHLLLTVIDKKADDLVITDGGTNAVGWERFEHDAFPVLNLSRPSPVERPCYVMGSLCTPHDFWGYTYHGAGIEVGDVLLIPTQGAYTYSLRQEFIKPLPRVVALTGTHGSGGNEQQ